jgi:DNA-binding winged helix-turn-helix (wHTH) protein
MPTTIYEFGPFRLDVGERVLTVEGRPVAIPPKELDTLSILLENHGHIVEKHQLLNCVWPGVFVEEGNLARHISYLRHRLSEHDQAQPFIETVPKRGYRFVAPVTVIRPAAKIAEENAESIASLFTSPTIFAGAELAGRIDFAEARMCATVVSALGSLRGFTPIVQPIAGGLAVYSKPGSPLNKVIGLGLTKDLDLAPLAVIEEQWRLRREAVRVELSTLADPVVACTLSERGFRMVGFENVLGCHLNTLPPQKNDSRVEVELVDDDKKRAFWVEVAVKAFSTLDGTGAVAEVGYEREQLTEDFTDASTAPDFHHYLAYSGGLLAGVATLRMDGTLAQIWGGGTLPQFRGRGVQKALLLRRMQDAKAAGCEMCVIITPPGARSQENALRSGFTLLYSRAIFVKSFDDRQE